MSKEADGTRRTNLSDGGGPEIEVDADSGQIVDESPQELRAHEQNGLPEVPHALPLDEPRISVVASVPPHGMPVDEALKTTAQRRIVAIDIPRDDKADKRTLGPPRSEPLQRGAAVIQRRPRGLLHICPNPGLHPTRVLHICDIEEEGFALSPGGM